MKDRWLRRWFDESGELCAIVREGGDYFIRTTTWKYGEQYRSVSEEEAKSYDFDPDGNYTYMENIQAMMEYDHFFE